ncbi:MAG TPA: M4 family metallopeptidase [Allosphingosinicella sp.]|nr:M4 family metallopeptidase [Allosphingosinicella sp.]
MPNPGGAGGNGLSGFSVHSANSDDAGVMGTLNQEVALAGFGLADPSPRATDPETAARQYLENAIASAAAPSFTMPSPEGLSGGFRLLGTETIELTGTKTVKFRQVFNKIPVYGSLVTVELDENNALIGINSALGAPENVSPVAEVAPAEAVRTLRKAGADPEPGEVGRLVFYYDDRDAEPRWRLCYLFEDVSLAERDEDDDQAPAYAVMPMHNYLVDAHSGEIVVQLNRIAGATTVQALDELGVTRDLRVSANPSPPANLLHDPVANVHTYDHAFRDWQLRKRDLTSQYCTDPPSLSPGAVSAHANATAVVEFLRNVLRRRGLDNRDGPLISSVNCIYWRQPAGPNEWRNAAWIGSQMVYGQRSAGANLVSTAADLDVVAHEIVHGLTQFTANLEYLGETGALNESYSDIFGVIIANFDKPDRDSWDYRIGLTFRGDGNPLRDISNPATRGFPAHMDDYVAKADDDDSGGVHTNSSIHNKAAHAIMVARGADGSPLFSASELAGLFYLALTQHLSRRSRFSDSRRALEASALTLFRLLPQPQIQERLTAIRDAFDSVGIA